MANHIEAKLPNGEVLILSPPTVEQYDRYTKKTHAGERSVGRRELIQVTATSHQPEVVAELLAKYPGVIIPLSDSVSGMATSDDDPTVEDGSVLYAGATFRVPTLDEWMAWQEGRHDSISQAAREFCTMLTDSKGAAEEAFRRYPGDAILVAHELGKLVGTGVEIIVKKG